MSSPVKSVAAIRLLSGVIYSQLSSTRTLFLLLLLFLAFNNNNNNNEKYAATLYYARGNSKYCFDTWLMMTVDVNTRKL